MKKPAFTLLIFLAMTGVASASIVTLGIVDNGVPQTGLRSFTITATGTGIMQLGEFKITVPGSNLTELAAVYQDFQRNSSGPHYQVESDLSPYYLPGIDYNPDIDSHVLFGTQRYPDLIATPVWPGPGERPDFFTAETLDDLDPLDDTKGWGTLNNSAGACDAYCLQGPPPTIPDEEVELIQLVVEDIGAGMECPFQIDLTLYTAENYDPVTSYVELEEHVLSSAVPEPGTVAMLIAGGLCLAFVCQRKKKSVWL